MAKYFLLVSALAVYPLSMFCLAADRPACEVLDKDIVGEYQGECLRGLAHGQGRAKGKDSYEGEFRAGKPHGNGRYSWTASGSYYEGTFADGLPHGNGLLVRGPKAGNPADRYEGEFKNGKRTGYGTYFFASGDVYRGEQVDGKWQGNGEYVWANGCRYLGRFEADKGIPLDKAKCPPNVQPPVR